MSDPPTLDVAALRRALALADLTDPTDGPHALQELVAAACGALESLGCLVRVVRANPIVTVRDNYDDLHYPAQGAARDARYTRYVADGVLLRTQTSALVPGALRRLAREPQRPADVALACPGVVYRRDCIDRLHAAEPHQLDLWRVRESPALEISDLDAMIGAVVDALLPRRRWRTLAAEHPYTTDGRQIDVAADERGAWVEIGECGLALPALLAASGLGDAATGLAMGLGLDRILMLRKGVDDIRLLRATDPRVAGQMLDLSPYRPVSSMPPVRRDLSIVCAAAPDAEAIGDRVRACLGADAELVEEIAVVSVTRAEELPEAAARRLGIAPGQVNVLLRLVLRALDRTLTHAECNVLRDRVYEACHEGGVWHWAARA